MNELPRGWARATLGSVVALVNGSTPKGLTSVLGGSVPFYKVADMNRAEGNVMDEAGIYLDDASIKRFRLRVAPPGTIILPKVGGAIATNKKRLLNQPAAFDTNTLGVVPASAVSSEFILYCLQAIDLRHLTYGSPVPQVDRERLLELDVNLPPSAEQGRIVAAIEEHLSCLDAAERSLHGARQKLEALRHITLQHAIDGDWPFRPLGEVLVSLRNGVFVSRPAAEPPGIPIFRISAVRPLTLEVDDVRFADIDPAKADGYFVQEGDLLFTRYSGNPEYVGACACVDALPRPTLHPDKLIRAVVDRSLAEPGFIAIALSTGPGRSAIEQRRKTTAGQVGIAGSELKKVPVPIPPLDEQRRILAEAERQLSIVAAMAAQISRALRRSAGLRRSILEQAFTGNLVPQDPSDEPASVLLERIAAERAAAPKPSRRKRKTPA